MQTTIIIKTKKKQEFIDITETVQDTVKRFNVKEGIGFVYVKHSTASIIINENYDPNICLDTLDILNKTIPLHNNYRHDKIDNNAAAHIKASILGPSEFIPVKNNELQLGKWQSIMLTEFDGPRERHIIIQVLEKA